MCLVSHMTFYCCCRIRLLADCSCCTTFKISGSVFAMSSILLSIPKTLDLCTFKECRRISALVSSWLSNFFLFRSCRSSTYTKRCKHQETATAMNHDYAYNICRIQCTRIRVRNNSLVKACLIFNIMLFTIQIWPQVVDAPLFPKIFMWTFNMSLTRLVNIISVSDWTARPFSYFLSFVRHGSSFNLYWLLVFLGKNQRKIGLLLRNSIHHLLLLPKPRHLQFSDKNCVFIQY